jgi:ATP-dependent Lhr-like helicase
MDGSASVAPAADWGALFSEPTRAWFTTTFGAPTEAQRQCWPAVASGGHTLLLAPTGSGKTLAAFLWSIDRLMTSRREDAAASPEASEVPSAGPRVLYLSPLRALAVDIDKNLRAPLRGIELAAARLDVPVRLPTVGVRTGDTPADERRMLAKRPPDILITTPESLYLMLTSAARETLRSVETVILDEIHALAATKRGAHLALSLERLDELCAATPHRTSAPQRIGLSATQRPLEEIARFLGGYDDSGQPRPVTIVDAGVRKQLEIEVVVPVEDMGQIGKVVEAPMSGPVAAGPQRTSIWPAIHPQLLDLVEQHRSTIIFVNARRLAERLAARLNELAHERAIARGEVEVDPITGVPLGDASTLDLVKAHHGSLSRERRLQIEDELKTGRVRALVATSSLELGIDMGAVDLVIQVESPGAVSRGLQRIGRAGHQVGAPSRGTVFPKHRSDLLEAAIVVSRMKAGLIEETRYPRNPLDVLAQQIVAMCALEDWPLDRLRRVCRRAANFADISDEVFDTVLDLLAGRYPSEEFSELRPRIVWDRVESVIRARAGAQRLAVTSGGTIPDRGLFGVFLPDGTRVGELDEEMVYESRPGETFLLGASTWRIEEITFDRVVVTPAPGQIGKMPFWRGEGPGRPVELGRALGAFVREVREMPRPAATQRLRTEHCLDERAADNLLRYLDEQAEATGVVPDDRTIVVERFRDEIGDWRVCVHSPFGAPVHAPWTLALQASLEARWGTEVEAIWSDDGIVLRLPGAIEQLDVRDLAIDPEDLDELVVDRLPSSSLFAARFRECAARALLLPRRRPDRRTPLWQQRQRAADLLSVAAKYPQFPILLETTREICTDVFDLAALRSVLTDVRSRAVRMVQVDTAQASPFAQSMLFGWIAMYMYEGDAPLAERRAAALALDRDLLRELLGAEELRELLDRDVLADLELELQRLVPERHARDIDEVHDLFRVLGPLSREEVVARSIESIDVDDALERLSAERRAIPVMIADHARFAASDDAARLRDALGVSLPQGLPAAFTQPVDDPLGDLVRRYARTHGPFLGREVSERLGVPIERIRSVLDRFTSAAVLVRGEFRPDGVEREWCDPEVLRQLRRRTLSALRREIEPVEHDVYARFLTAWHSIDVPKRGLDGLVEVLGTLQGAAIPASVLEVDVLSARLAGYRGADLDALCTAGEVVWIGDGAIGPTDGRVRLYFRDQVHLLAPAPNAATTSAANSSPSANADPSGGEALGALHEALLAHLEQRGASFWPDLVRAASDAQQAYDDATVLAALWDLVWGGLVTNDSLAPVRAYVGGGAKKRAPAGGARSRPRLGRLSRLGPPAGAGRWSLVRELVEPRPTPTESAHALVHQLLERSGVLAREGALAEGVPGGFAAIYPVLAELEARGQVRRGYFVTGLGAAQFALPGAVDRLRALRLPVGVSDDAENDDRPATVLSAVDPAQPYGGALPWPPSPGRPSRSAGALVVLIDGHPAVLIERGGTSLVTFAGADPQRWAPIVVRAIKDGRRSSLEIRRIDGQPVADSAIRADLLAAGFAAGYRGLVLRDRS